VPRPGPRRSADMQTRKELYETLEYTPGEEWVMPAHFNK
jgi:hypothetical protein